MSIINDNSVDILNLSDPFLVSFRRLIANPFLDVFKFLTPASELNYFADRESEIAWGRDGNDSLLGFDPSADNLEQLQIDLFLGDGEDLLAVIFGSPNLLVLTLGFAEIFSGINTGVLESLSEPSSDSLTLGQRDWTDRYILGDWQQPYYVSDQPITFGLNQFALIADFSPEQDLIQLHGTPADYQLIDFPLGTAIFWQQETGSDLIALLLGVSGLSLDNEFFQFKGDTSPQGPVLEETQQIGTAGIDFLFGSTTDSLGNLYVGGGTSGSLGESSAGPRDAWLAKYDSNGNQLWIEQFGTSSRENSWVLANDGGNIYVGGNTSGDLADTNQGGEDIYLAKFDSDGNQLWTRQFGSSSFDQSFSVATDSSGNIYQAGYTTGDLGGVNNNAQAIWPTTDSWLTKFDSDGNQLWIKQFGTDDVDDTYGLAIDKDDNVFLGGWTLGELGGENAGLYDIWLAKLDSDGQFEWIKQFGTPDYEFLFGIDTDSEGNIYASGWTLGDLEGANAGSYDVWVAKYDSNGDQVWLQQFGTEGDDGSFLGGIEVDSNDNIFLTGYTDSNLEGANAGSYDVWVAKYDSDGDRVWLQQFGTSDYDYAGSVSIDSTGNLFVTGFTEGSFGDANAGSVDSWVARLDAESGSLQDFSGNTFDSLEIEENESSGLAEFPTIDALASLSEGLTQPIPGTAEALIGNDPLNGSVPIPTLDFSVENFTNASV